MIALSCGTSGPTGNNSNTELVVTYNRQEEFRRNTRYISENHLRSLLDQGKEVIVIFAAEWCASCHLARRAITESNLSTKVYFINIDEPWAQQLAGLMNINKVPVMFHTGKTGNTLAIRVGASSIVSYLVLRY